MKPAGLIEGSVPKHVLNMAVPMGFGLLAVMSFQMIDMIFVGFLGEESLAAISFIFPLIFIVLGLGMGIGVGTMSHVGYFLGKNEEEKAREVATNGILLVGLWSIIIVCGGLSCINQTLSILGVPVYLQPLIKPYMEIWYIACAFILVPIVGNSIIRSTGDSKTPSLIMSIAGSTNIILDPLLIFGYGPVPEMGFQGAAIATAISYMITFFSSLGILIFKLKILKYPSFNKDIFASWASILHIGVPVGLTAMFTPLSQALLMGFVAKEGVAATAAFGISFRIESFAMIGVMALSHVIPPIVSQNYGAQFYDRIEECFVSSLKWSAVWCCITGFVLFFLSSWIGEMFSDETTLIHGIALYCWIVPITYWWQGVLDFLVAMLNSLKKPFISVLFIVMRLFILTVPLGYFGVTTWGLQGLYLGRAAGNLISGVIACGFAFSFLRNGLRKI